MDLAGLCALVSGFFENRGVPYALCGGGAMASYGFPLPTLDLDFVTWAYVQPALVGFLEEKGFSTLYRSEGFSNHAHQRFGRVDFVYVRGVTAEKVFARVTPRPGPGGQMVPAVAPEHLVAMKLAALRSDPSRGQEARVALAFLLRLPGLDLEEVQGYFRNFGFAELFHELQQSR